MNKTSLARCERFYRRKLSSYALSFRSTARKVYRTIRGKSEEETRSIDYLLFSLLTFVFAIFSYRLTFSRSLLSLEREMLLERRFFLGKIRRVSFSREKDVSDPKNLTSPWLKVIASYNLPLSLSLFIVQSRGIILSLGGKKNTLLFLPLLLLGRARKLSDRSSNKLLARKLYIYIYIYTRTMDVVRSEKASLTLDTGGEGGEGR